MATLKDAAHAETPTRGINKVHDAPDVGLRPRMAHNTKILCATCGLTIYVPTCG